MSKIEFNPTEASAFYWGGYGPTSRHSLEEWLANKDRARHMIPPVRKDGR